MIRPLCFATLLAGATICAAQAPAATEAAPTAAAAPSIAMPESTCVKPDIPMAKSDSRTIDRFNKAYKSYVDCVKKYVADNQALVDKIIAHGKVVIDEYNAFNEELKARQEAK
jgi:type IV pilus biogenesis protein CpaD/CtpE